MNGFLSDDELAKIREDFAELMPGTAIISRSTAGTGSLYAPHNKTWAAVGTVICRVDNLNRQDTAAMIADAKVGSTFYKLTIPYDADLRDGDKISVDSRNYECLQIQREQSANAVRRAILVTKDEGNG
jgi:hypothetical protein